MYFSKISINFSSTNVQKIVRENQYALHQRFWKFFPDDTKRSFLYREEFAAEQSPSGNNRSGAPVYYIVSQEKPLDQSGLFTLETKPYRPKLKVGQRLNFRLRANPVVAKKTEQGKSKKHDVIMDTQRMRLKELCDALNISSDKNKYQKSLLKGKLLSESLKKKLEKILSLRLERHTHFIGQSTEIKTIEQKLNRYLQAEIDAALKEWFQKKGEKQHGFQWTQDKETGVVSLQSSGDLWNSLPAKGTFAGFTSVDFSGEITITDPNKFMEALYKGIGHSKAFGCGLMMIKPIKN